jgi:hypothetical protein
MLHTNEKEPRRDLHTFQQARFLISNSSFALAVVFLLRSLRFVPNPEPYLEIWIFRIEDVVIEFVIGTPDVV